jgi:DNA-binding CsgD family transcriptional regulator
MAGYKELVLLLSGRERQVLGLMAEGLTNKEIASTLSIHASTVKRHAENILSKLHVKNRVQAAVCLMNSLRGVSTNGNCETSTSPWVHGGAREQREACREDTLQRRPRHSRHDSETGTASD